MWQRRGQSKVVERSLKGVIAVAVGGLLVCVVGAARAEENRRGFYVGLDLGMADALSSDSFLSGISQPTRCDSILWQNINVQRPAALSNDPACSRRTPKRIYTTTFDPGIGFAGGVSAGYALNMGLRVEAEYFYRNQSGDSSVLPPARGNVVTQAKNKEWSAPPSARLSDSHGHHVFLNAYYDFLNASRWTPYLGAGVGWSHVRAQYRNLFRRISIDDGYEDVFREVNQEYLDDFGSDLHITDIAGQAAGTVSSLDSGISDNLFGFQFLAGLDYALTERISLGVKARWARFESMSDNAVWDQVRNHAPVLADGVTPYRVKVNLDHLEFWAVTFGAKYRF